MLAISDKKFLKSKAHALKPVVQAGKRGISESFLQECDAALLAHELIKIKFHESAQNDKSLILNEICDKTQSELIDIKGHIAVLYREHPELPKILK